MYVFEEKFEGRFLHDVINEKNENPKYLPGIALPPNIRAESGIRRVVSGAHVLVFVMPHQFIKPLCTEIQGHILPGAKAISLVKGFDCENNQARTTAPHHAATSLALPSAHPAPSPQLHGADSLPLCLSISLLLHGMRRST